MRDVSIAGVGMIPFGKYPDRLVEELGRDAVIDAFHDCSATRDDVQETFVGSVFAGGGIGQRIAKLTGMSGMPITNIENACASGSTALRNGWLAVASGQVDVALVVGVDKLSGSSGPLIVTGGDRDAAAGLTMPALYAMRAQAYMQKYGVGIAEIAGVVVKNRANASMNSHSYFRQPVDLDAVLNSAMVAEPLTLYQCCPKVDGASAVILVAGERAKKFTDSPVRIVASQLCSGSFRPGYRDFASPEISVRAAREAYELAGLGPEDIDVAEIHDAFSISELLYYEALQFCPEGEATKFLRDGSSSLGGALPVNTSGGLIAKGHPPGATGLAQVHEVVTQLRGRAGDRQVKGARTGLVHCTGGGVSGYDHASASIHVLAR